MVRMLITHDDLDTILELAGLDSDTTDVRENYSGRFMYGGTCLGIVVPGDGEMAVLLAAIGIVLGEEDGLKVARNCCTDDMGQETIVYFPDVELG